MKFILQMSIIYYMAEKDSGYQLGIEELKEHDPASTHTILPGARIKVETKTRRGFAWGTVIGSEFDAVLQPREAEPHREKQMRLFLAMSAFSVYYINHDSTARYEGDTRLYAFPPKKGNVFVYKIPKPRKTK